MYSLSDKKRYPLLLLSFLAVSRWRTCTCSQDAPPCHPDVFRADGLSVLITAQTHCFHKGNNFLPSCLFVCLLTFLRLCACFTRPEDLSAASAGDCMESKLLTGKTRVGAEKRLCSSLLAFVLARFSDDPHRSDHLIRALVVRHSSATCFF